jgi:hypothetical protein
VLNKFDVVSVIQHPLPFGIELATDQLSHGGDATMISGFVNLDSSSIHDCLERSQ